MFNFLGNRGGVNPKLKKFNFFCLFFLRLPLGKIENEADNCKKTLTEKEKELKEKDEVIWRNKDARKHFAKDLTDLRFWSFCFNFCTLNAIMDYCQIKFPCPLELHPPIILLHAELLLFFFQMPHNIFVFLSLLKETIFSKNIHASAGV